MAKRKSKQVDYDAAALNAEQLARAQKQQKKINKARDEVEHAKGALRIARERVNDLLEGMDAILLDDTPLLNQKNPAKSIEAKPDEKAATKKGKKADGKKPDLKVAS